MIINNKNGFKVMVKDEALEDLNYVDAYAVVDILENASREDIKNGWVRDDIYEGSDYELYYNYEVDEEIDDAESFDNIREAAEISGALEHFDGDIDNFKFKIGCALRMMNIDREIWELLENVEVIDEDNYKITELRKYSQGLGWDGENYMVEINYSYITLYNIKTKTLSDGLDKELDNEDEKIKDLYRRIEEKINNENL